MVNDFTPDTDYVRRTFVSAQGPEERVGPGFDRWLTRELDKAYSLGYTHAREDIEEAK